MRWASAIDTDALLSTAVTHAAAKIFKDLGNQEPDLLTVFVSAHHAARFEELSRLLLREFESSYLFGCCAVGVIGGGQKLRTVLLSLDRRGDARRAHERRASRRRTGPRRCTPNNASGKTRCTDANQQPSFLILADPFSFETETFVRGLDRVYPSAPKSVASRAARQQVGGTILYLGNEVHRSGAIALALTGNVQIDTIVAQGCRPVGDPMFVTIAHEI